jgi:hypothetical protein
LDPEPTFSDAFCHLAGTLNKSIDHRAQGAICESQDCDVQRPDGQIDGQEL